MGWFVRQKCGEINGEVFLRRGGKFIPKGDINSSAKWPNQENISLTIWFQKFKALSNVISSTSSVPLLSRTIFNFVIRHRFLPHQNLKEVCRLILRKVNFEAVTFLIVFQHRISDEIQADDIYLAFCQSVWGLNFAKCGLAGPHTRRASEWNVLYPKFLYQYHVIRIERQH